MLRIYFLQQWFNLSDPAVEEALYDSAVMRQFVGIDLGCEPVPDETTVCKFRHLLEEHELGEQILGTVNLHLQAQGSAHHDGHDRGCDHPARAQLRPRTGSSSAIRRCTRRKKGNQWCVSRTRAQARDAVPKMGDGLPEPAYRSRLQTARCCCVQKAWW